MTESKIFPETYKREMKNGEYKGKFKATTTIGFNGLLKITYTSRVVFKEPNTIILVSETEGQDSFSS